MSDSMNQTERGVEHRRLGREGKTEREIAQATGFSKATVHRDLNFGKKPIGTTPAGTPYYPPGRFDDEPEYQDRVAELKRDMPERVARLQAAREFAGPPARNPLGMELGSERARIAQGALKNGVGR